MRVQRPPLPVAVRLLGAVLLALLALPGLALVVAVEPAALFAAVGTVAFRQALWLSVATSLVSLLLVVIGGLPLAWWLSRAEGVGPRVVDAIVSAPIVLPPAVVGVGLLLAFGQAGPLGGLWSAVGWSAPFTTAAVVIAQVVVAAPFFVQSAAAAFRRVDADTLLVARTLGARPFDVVRRVALPMAAPGVVAGASLAWARALGEFGATLLFAGSRAGVTRTAPLATYAALETDVALAVAFSLTLVAVAFFALGVVRGVRVSGKEGG